MPNAAKAIDTTHYPETDFMGQGGLQRLMADLMCTLLAAFLAKAGRVAHVGANQFIYYQQFNTAKRTAPDIYVFRNVPQSQVMPSWKLWEMTEIPAFCLEIVSLDVGKDYDEMPPIHSDVGTRELVVYDPDAGGRHRRERHVWQVHRRTKRGLYLVETSSADRVYSKELRCWLRVVGRNGERRLRVATGEHGDVLVPTEREMLDTQGAALDRERAEKEREHAEKERERAARVAAEAEVAELRSKLEAAVKRRR